MFLTSFSGNPALLTQFTEDIAKGQDSWGQQRDREKNGVSTEEKIRGEVHLENPPVPDFRSSSTLAKPW